MKVRKDGIGLNGPLGTALNVKQVAAHENTGSSPLAVGTVAQAIGLGNNANALFRNVSTGGQQLKIGSTPVFGAPPFGRGMLLYPGDSYALSNVQPLPQISVIADSPGALLELSLWQVP